MADLINHQLTRAAFALANTLDYARAAERLGLKESELREQIEALEEILCFHIFDPDSEQPVLTEGGRLFMQKVGTALAGLNQIVVTSDETDDEPR